MAFEKDALPGMYGLAATATIDGTLFVVPGSSLVCPPPIKQGCADTSAEEILKIVQS